MGIYKYWWGYIAKYTGGDIWWGYRYTGGDILYWWGYLVGIYKYWWGYIILVGISGGDI